jgi:hypothetical protein
MPKFQPGDKVWVAPDVVHGVMVPVPLTVIKADGPWYAECLRPHGHITVEQYVWLFPTKEEATRRELDSLRGWIEGIESTPIPEGWE